jgi:ParB family chromosome partitioning protein
LEFEEAALITLGLCYMENGRFSGGAYHPILRRSDQFIKKPLKAALPMRRERARTLMNLDAAVIEKVDALKAKGLTSPYLKNFVVARINPLRFRPKDAAPLSFDEVLDRMTQGVEKMNVEKIKVEDLARSGGAPDE